MLSNVLSSPVELSAPAEQTRVDWLRIARVILLLVLPCACFWPALDGSFQWDDALLISENPLIETLGGLRDMWFSTRPYDYFPIVNSAFWVQWHLWGSDPLGYHLVNLALHVTTAFMLWRLLRVLRVPGAWLGAVLFAVHPVNTAAVAWISECKTLMAMPFYLGSLICYARLDDGPAEKVRGRYAAALALHVLAQAQAKRGEAGATETEAAARKAWRGSGDAFRLALI